VTPPGALVKTLEGRKLRRGSADYAFGLNTHVAARIRCWNKALEARPEISTRNPLGPRVGASAAAVHSWAAAVTEQTPGGPLRDDESRRAGSEGKPLESRWNPMGVTGMKQGRASGRGVNRREGEKP
jgi:hypothetical protein